MHSKINATLSISLRFSFLSHSFAATVSLSLLAIFRSLLSVSLFAFSRAFISPIIIALRPDPALGPALVSFSLSRSLTPFLSLFLSFVIGRF